MAWDIAVAITAFLAAVFWFISAYGRLPKMVAYWDYTPDSDPFYKAVKFSAKMNRIASVFAGISALLTAGKVLYG